jgi:Fe-S-cluster containining protein
MDALAPLAPLAAPVPFGQPKIRRKDVPPGKSLCEYCTAKCCKYFALPIEDPETFEEFEYLRWFLLHDRASVFKEEGSWYLLVHTTCKHLRSDNMCGIYETRPQICRDYTTDNCEFYDDWVYDFYLETPEQVWDYTEAILQDPLETGSIRSPKPNPLAILS